VTNLLVALIVEVISEIANDGDSNIEFIPRWVSLEPSEDNKRDQHRTNPVVQFAYQDSCNMTEHLEHCVTADLMQIIVSETSVYARCQNQGQNMIISGGL
jgi:hypothetical protein